MCGIAGALIFQNSHFRITEDYLVRMRDAMVHRGPDGSGIWISPDCRVGLAHRRLSIVDLSDCASQPMCNEDGSLQVVFNGEIYNHAEIRAELEVIGGHTWKTDHSDTEVILHAFEEWGIDCIHRFRGMFAFALWDTRTKQMWLIRDRIGIKPLYYSVHHGRITFASEIKALLQDPDQIRAVNEESLYYYLSFIATPAPQTLFEGIRKLPAGSLLNINIEGEIREERYWDVLDHTDPLKNASEQEIAEQLMQTLKTSVRLRQVSDVPVGIFLSGGIDSSTNAVLFSESATGRVKTFSVAYDQNYQGCESELPYAKRVAEQIDAEYHERILTQDDFLDFLPRMIQLQDEPIADPVCMPVYYVSKLARDNGVIVCQVGEGSDELFWGYSSWKRMLRLHRLNRFPIPSVLKRIGLHLLSISGRSTGFPYAYLDRAVSGKPIFWGGAEGFTRNEMLAVVSPRLREKFAGMSAWTALEPIYQRFQEKCWEKTPVKWMTYLDLNFRLPELLLMRVDKMGMGVSLEARVPFLDHKFVELAMSIPESVITRDFESKHILKKAVRGVIPDEIIDRKKQGFGVPVYEWFFDKFGEYAKRELMEFCEQADFLDRDAVLKLVNEKRGWHAWFLLNFALWWKEYVSESAEDRNLTAVS